MDVVFATQISQYDFEEKEISAMIISHTKKFIFIAGLKTGSTSIEAALRPYGDIFVRTTRAGKHMSLIDAERLFLQEWPARYLPQKKEWFRFGVMRDPASYVVSIYNSHTKPGFAGRPQYTGEISFEEFFEQEVLAKASWDMQDQHKLFLNSAGEMGMDFIARYENLETDLNYVAKNLGINIQLAVLNKSPLVMRVDKLSKGMHKQIKDLFADDYAFYERYTGAAE